MPRNSSSRKGITRIENYKRRADGWWVRLQRNGVKYSAFFKDSDYASKWVALNVARNYFLKLSREHPRSRKDYAERKTSRSRSGIVGVRKVVKERKGHEYEFWIATWSPKMGANQKCKAFSIDRYGKREAKRLAIEARKKGLEEMIEK